MEHQRSTPEQGRYAIIGIAIILAAVMIAGYALSDLQPWALLALGAPASLILGSSSRIRRMRGHRPKR